MEKEKSKKEKAKKEYSIFNNYWYLYKEFFKVSRWNLLISIMILAGGILAGYVWLYVPKVAVALVMEQVSVQKLVGTLLLMELGYFLLRQSERTGYLLLRNQGLKYRHVLEERMLHKICSTAYSDLEDPDYKNKLFQAQQLYLHWDRDARECIWTSLYFLHLLITILITSGLMSRLHPAVVAVLVLGVWLQYQVEKRPVAWVKKHRKSWEPLERKLSYISEKVGSFPHAKDMRLYAADRWLMPKYASMLRERRYWKKKQRNQATACNMAVASVEMARQAAVYGFLIWSVLVQRVKPDDFVLYTGMALSLSNSLGQIAERVRDLREKELSISDYRAMLSMPDSRRKAAEGLQAVPMEEQQETGAGLRKATVVQQDLKTGQGKAAFVQKDPEVGHRSAENRQHALLDKQRVLPQETGTDAAETLSGSKLYISSDQAPGIRFSHVSFTYPGAEADTLQDVDIEIGPGEKVALVGLNGAGKTTLIKLLCGMYEPTKGEIQLNGKSSENWSLEEWYQLFSVVFQDIGVIPTTILENVAACAAEDADRERVKRCLEQAGLLELVESLPHGMDTYLPKEIFKEGVNLSGGETQKLLLARAIYKEAPVLVLDEPTAALDAIAENQLYLRYNELTKGRTSLFISHRLSSTRFCDRILMLEGGRVVEQGSHEELMAKKGVYYNLFQVQSHYYQNDRTEEFSSNIDPEWEVSSYVSG